MEHFKKHAMKVLKIGALGAGSGMALGYTIINPETVQALLGSAVQEKAVQFGVAFSLAAWLHSSQVKKEIAKLGSGIITSVNAVAEALQLDLRKQAQRMDKLEGVVLQINKRVESLEGE